MKLKRLRRAISLTLSAGIVLGVPAVLPQMMPTIVIGQTEAAEAQGVSWTFQEGLDGWKYGGKWAYKGVCDGIAGEDLGLKYGGDDYKAYYEKQNVSSTVSQ